MTYIDMHMADQRSLRLRSCRLLAGDRLLGVQTFAAAVPGRSGSGWSESQERPGTTEGNVGLSQNGEVCTKQGSCGSSPVMVVASFSAICLAREISTCLQHASGCESQSSPAEGYILLEQVPGRFVVIVWVDPVGGIPYAEASFCGKCSQICCQMRLSEQRYQATNHTWRGCPQTTSTLLAAGNR